MGGGDCLCEGVKVTLTSNGSLMSKDLALALLEANLERINFSIDGLDKQSYEKIRLGLNFEEVLGNALQFIKLRDWLNAKTAVRISIIKSHFTINHIDKIIKFWEKMLDFSKGDNIKIDDLSLGITDKSKDKGLNALDYERVDLFREANKTPCYVIFNTAVIKTDGQVALCCVDQCRNVTLGDLNTQSLSKIWQHSKGLKKIRKVHLEHGRAGILFCKNCSCWFDKARILSDEFNL